MINKRKGKQYEFWRTQVLERDKYICVKCQTHKKNLHAHHIIPWEENIELRLCVENGMTLCGSCHTKLHKTGRVSWAKGKKFSEDYKRKLSLAKLGKPSPKKGIKTGHTPWNKGIKTGVGGPKGIKFTDEHKEKLSIAKKGKLFSIEHKEKLKLARAKNKEKGSLLYKGKTWSYNRETNKREWH